MFEFIPIPKLNLADTPGSKHCNTSKSDSASMSEHSIVTYVL